MARCKSCGVEIEDGLEYCEVCKLEKSTNEDDWDFLDMTIARELSESSAELSLEEGIPEQGALDEVGDILQADYEEIIRNKSDEFEDEITNIQPDEELSFFHDMLSEEISPEESFHESDLLSNLEDEDNTDLLDSLSFLNEEDTSLVEPSFEDTPETGHYEVEEPLVIEEPITEEVSMEPEETKNEETVFSLEDFDDLLNDSSLFSSLDETGGATSTSDILSASLSGVSSLEDAALEEQFNNLLPEQEQTELHEEKEKKGGLFKKMFANIPPENPEEERLKEERLETEAKEKKQKKAEEKCKKAEAKKEKAEANKVAKEEKKRLKLEEKEKKKKAKEELAASYVPEGKINRLGASIVCGIVALFGIYLIYTSFSYTYDVTIQSVKNNMVLERYTEAYDAISGLDVREKDQRLYRQLKTIMLINKQKSSYYNLKEIHLEVEALDSLVKGIDRYHRFYNNAKELDVADIYDKIKTQIDTELMNNYQITSEEAWQINRIQDAKEYTKKLTTIVEETSTKPTNQVADTKK